MDPYQYYKRDFPMGGGGTDSQAAPSLDPHMSVDINLRNQFGPRFAVWQNVGHNLDEDCFDTLTKKNHAKLLCMRKASEK